MYPTNIRPYFQHISKPLSGIVSLLLIAINAYSADVSAPADSLAWDDGMDLDELIVIAEHPRNDIIPTQQLEGEELHRLNSNSVADALRYFSGVQVKDYGGVGGIKTVNIRSMGTNHTGVVYDGVELGNAQNGQIDLGQFSLDNIEAISLHNGQRSRILQPAKDFGSAGSIYMRTRTPHFEEGEKYHLRATMRAGSFALFNPSALLELKLSEKVCLAFSAEWLNSNGKYKFRYRRVTPGGEVAYDTVATRQNGDVNATRLECNVNGILRSGEWRAKVYNYNSERGIPGAIVNNVWRRGERVWDNNSFAQASFRKNIGVFTTLANAKYAFYRTHYVNNDEQQLKIDNLYKQREVYLSTANEVKLLPFWHLSLSYDFQWNDMWADVTGFRKPTRFTNLLALATSMNWDRLRIQASGMGTFISDRREGDTERKHRQAFTPTLSLSFNPLRNPDFSIRGFVKQSYRMPTFNDLYYADIGNSKLNPEKATQYDLGMLYEHTGAGLLSIIRVSADGYYNKIKDKIVAYPKGQQFRWTMLNLGVVDIKGVDINAMATINPWSDLLLTLRGQYTWQRAIDVTDPSDTYYRNQIPYIPRHSGSAVFNASWHGISLNYSFIYVGARWNQQENILYNYMQPWYTSDLSASYDFRVGKVDMRALVEVNNLLSQDYDVIVNYPMPKRNFRVSLTVTM